MTEEWLDFIVACRIGKSHDYDIVEGPMVDDQIWDYVEDYSSGKISKTYFAFTATPKNKTLEMFGEKMFVYGVSRKDCKASC